MSERQYALWDGTDLSKSIMMDGLDQGSGLMFVKYDEDTRMVYLAGKGDGNIRYYEIDESKAPFVHQLSEYKTGNPQRGVGWMPKTALDVNACEVMRCYKLHPKGFVEPISFTVPRKSTLFQEDVFPPTKEQVAQLGAKQWASGETKAPSKIDMRQFYVGKSSSKPKGLGGGGGLKRATPKPSAPVAAAPVATPQPTPAAAPTPAAPKPAPVRSMPAAADVKVTATPDVMPKTLKGLREAFTSHVEEIKALKIKVAQLEAMTR
jgi:hypothetical protein